MCETRMTRNILHRSGRCLSWYDWGLLRSPLCKIIRLASRGREIVSGVKTKFIDHLLTMISLCIADVIADRAAGPDIGSVEVSVDVPAVDRSIDLRKRHAWLDAVVLKIFYV